MTDPFYRSKQWKKLREARLKLDNYACVVAGCGARAVVVDHIVRRRDGGADTLSNLRSLCREHDQQVKERPSGRRANAGQLTVKGCFADGSPRDPAHPWFTGGGGIKQ
ncbi:MAG TPA: HNH endonuclease [Stellaceae bacterium]|jgi:5-methylcytosine-specific restriction endonuclease McrA